MTEDKMVGWHHRLSGRELGQAPGDGDGREASCAAVHGIFQARVLEWVAIVFSDRCEHWIIKTAEH